MTKEVINTNNAPEAIGPYSQGVIVGDFVYTSGQIPLNPVTGELVTDIKAIYGKYKGNFRRSRNFIKQRSKNKYIFKGFK